MSGLLLLYYKDWMLGAVILGILPMTEQDTDVLIWAEEPCHASES